MLKKLVFDIETRNTFNEVGSRSVEDLDISVVVFYDYLTDKYYSYQEDTLADLWPLIEARDLLIGYNSDHFDIPLLNKYYSGDLSQMQSLDLLVEIKEALGRRIRLDSVAAGTLGLNKSGHGLEAVQWWKDGQIDKIIKYCQDDVKITKDVYEYALQNQELKYKWLNKVEAIKLDTSTWEEKDESKVINYTLPF